MFKVLIVDDEEWNRDIIKNLGRWDELGMVVAGRPRTDWRRCG